VLQLDRGPSVLLLIDLARGRNRLGMSASWRRCSTRAWRRSADLDDPGLLADSRPR
jgi:hypothetical protein